MKFTILRNDLASALATVIGAIDTRQTQQILSHVLIETTADGLLLTGTNLEIELQAEAKATIAETGRSTVPARKLYDLVRNLPEGAEEIGRASCRERGCLYGEIPGVAVTFKKKKNKNEQ